MTLEAGKELDRKCVFDWLNKVYITPSLFYSEYTDEEIRMFAHDALALLKEQKAVRRTSRTGTDGFSIVWTCGACGSDLFPNNAKAKYCSNCGKAVKWNDCY